MEASVAYQQTSSIFAFKKIYIHSTLICILSAVDSKQAFIRLRNPQETRIQVFPCMTVFQQEQQEEEGEDEEKEKKKLPNLTLAVPAKSSAA